MEKRNVSTDLLMNDMFDETPVVSEVKESNNPQPAINVDSLTVSEENVEPAVEVTVEDVNTENNTEQPVQPKKKDRGDGSIDVVRFKNLTQIFNKGEENEYKLFQNFSLAIPDIPDTFQSIGVMGASGCGKSRLMRVLCKLDTVQEGSVEVYGKTEYGNIPCVFQTYSNYEWMTVIENVKLPMIVRGIDKESADKKAMELLELVGMVDKANNYPAKLSGGQQQRISIARALACDSQIIVFDEATSALDVKMKREIDNTVLNVLYNYEKDPTIITISHNIEEVLYTCNHVIVLKPNPCEVYKTFDIHYPGEEERQRGEWIFETPEYAEYSRMLTKAMDEIC